MLFSSHDVFIDGELVVNQNHLIGKRVINNRGDYYTIKSVIKIDDDSIKVDVSENSKMYILKEEYFKNIKFVKNPLRKMMEFIHRRDIQFVFHFTNIMNLDSILSKGLITRNQLDSNTSQFNDFQRLDNTDAICTSISFPNYKMFYKCRDKNPDEEWCVISLDSRVLFNYDCGFFIRNAASSGFADRTSNEYKGVEALTRLFSQTYFSRSRNTNIIRSTLNIPNNYTTNPQAEVLLFDSISIEDITCVYVNSSNALKYFSDKYPNIRIIKDNYYYSPRCDYMHW